MTRLSTTTLSLVKLGLVDICNLYGCTIKAFIHSIFIPKNSSYIIHYIYGCHCHHSSPNIFYPGRSHDGRLKYNLVNDQSPLQREFRSKSSRWRFPKFWNELFSELDTENRWSENLFLHPRQLRILASVGNVKCLLAV